MARPRVAPRARRARVRRRAARPVDGVSGARARVSGAVVQAACCEPGQDLPAGFVNDDVEAERESDKKFRGYVFTLFPDQVLPEGCVRPDAEDLVKGLPFSYLVFGREFAPTTNRFHLQGYIYFANQRTWKSVLKSFAPYGPYLRVAIADGEKNFHYCSKSGDFFEHGRRPMSARARGEAEKSRWSEALDLARLGQIDSVDARIQIPCIRSLERVEERAVFQRDLPTLRQRRNLWICGPSDCGKGATIARIFHPEDVFEKQANKWWDHYRGEPVVWIDEANEQFGSWSGDFVRKWCNYAPFSAERKFGAVKIRPYYVFFTSNTHPRDVYAKESQENLDAIMNRFDVLDLFFHTGCDDCVCNRCAPSDNLERINRTLRRVVAATKGWFVFSSRDGFAVTRLERNHPFFEERVPNVLEVWNSSGLSCNPLPVTDALIVRGRFGGDPVMDPLNSAVSDPVANPSEPTGVSARGEDIDDSGACLDDLVAQFSPVAEESSCADDGVGGDGGLCQRDLTHDWVFKYALFRGRFQECDHCRRCHAFKDDLPEDDVCPIVRLPHLYMG